MRHCVEIRPDMQLSRDAIVNIKGDPCPLGKLVEALIGYDKNILSKAFDERGQSEIGQYLLSQLMTEDEYRRLREEDDVEIRIITDDEHISRLPWTLLAHKGIFRCASGWAVSLSKYTESENCELPPAPKMLVIAPEPVGVGKTKAESHLEKLENLLSVQNHLLAFGRHLKLVSTWEEFVRLMRDFQPQIVYYYGHGIGDIHTARLRFATGNDNRLIDKPISDFAQVLRNMETPPYIAYINCCQGDAGGFLGVGMQLNEFVPAVITNRTVAVIEAAQSQAMTFWEMVLLKGLAPHKAVSILYSRLTDLDLSTADVQWMTPVIHCRYDRWKSNPPKAANRLDHDPHWHLKVDRVKQFSMVATQTRQMLRERKPRSLAFVWYGQEGQGIDDFHQRLNVELREDLSNTFVYEVRPEWPVEFQNFHRSCSDMLTEVFEVAQLEDIPARIRSKTQGTPNKQTLMYVRHQTVRSSRLINPKILKRYLDWWDHNFMPLLKDTPYFALLGISFVVKNPPEFQRLILEEELIEDLELQDTVFRLLDEMENIARRDLLDFIRTHNIRLPIRRRDEVLERILIKTRGHYNKTIEELRNLVDQAWDFGEEDGEIANKPEGEYDY